MIKLDKKKLVSTVIDHFIKNASEKNEDIETTIKDFLDETHDAYGNLENPFDGVTSEEIDNFYNKLCRKLKGSNDELDKNSEFNILFKLLHTIEHSLTKHAALVTGLENQTFTGSVLLELGAILIYENRNVSAGGADFLINFENLYNWIFNSKKQLVTCSNDCEDGCAKCIFHNDPNCHPIWQKEFPKTWVIPNSLLSRKTAQIFLSGD